MRRFIVRGGIVLVLFSASCAGSQAVQEAAAPAAQELANIKAQVMAADYRGDLNELGRLRDQLGKWGNAAELVYLARYWKGFASWRMAINGANQQMKAAELTANLTSAAADFYSSLRLKEDFADGYAAAALVNGWLVAIHISGAGPDTVEVRERFSLSQMLFVRASALDAQNPRVLWAKAAFILYRPDGKPENVTRAIELYEQMLKESDRRGLDAASPLPDWGKPEALMSLAFAHTRQTPPDLILAREEARLALKIVPEWSYVRDMLLPQIEQGLGGKR